MSSLLFRPAELFGLILDDVSEKEESGGEPIKNLCIVAAARKKAGLGETQDFKCGKKKVFIRFHKMLKKDSA